LSPVYISTSHRCAVIKTSRSAGHWRVELMPAELSWVILQLLDYVEPGGPSEAAGLPRYACQDLFDVNLDASGAYATVLFCY